MDCTNLLNLRHLFGRDNGWMFPYPAQNDFIDFDSIRKFGNGNKLAIVTYGKTSLCS